MAKYLDETGAEQLNQLLAAKFDTKVDKVLNTKTYENILGTASNTTWTQNTFYFASVKPTSFIDMWTVRYRIYVWVESDNNYSAVSDCFFRGNQSNVQAYACFNNIYSTSYRPAYYHTMYRLLEDGFNAGYGHAIGVSLKDANAKDTVGKERTIKVELLEQINCSVTLLDTPLKWGDWPGMSDTNYSGATGNPSSYNFSANGLQETGDANDNTIAYMIKNYYEKPIIGAGNIYRNNLCTYDTDWKIQGFVKSNSTGTSKQKNTATFRIGMPIFYLNSTSSQTVGSVVGDNLLCTQMQTVDFRYSSNCGATLVQYQPVFLVGIPDGDTFTLADTWWTQTLPSTEDGKIYIYLGNAYSTNKYSIAFQLYHPIYWYKNGALRLYTDDSNYIKPTGGIPKTDLASDVQTSLGKADTALQGMTILSYGSSTWNDFITAYNNKSVVYCRASSENNPATGSQTRLAFMAYVNNAANPTEVEFQYYRSVNTHSDSQQGDQVYVYKLNSSGTWTVTLRNAFSKVVAGTNMSSSYLNGVITLEATDTTYESKTAASGGTDVSLVTTGEKYTWNNKGNGTITKVQANGTDVASSGTANIPAASTSAYGVTKLSSATDSTSEVLAATPKAVKAAYDLAAGKGTGTITGVSVNGTSVATSGVANITSVPASILSGTIPSAVTATTQSASDNSTKIATTAFVQTAIDNLPEPMVFKGSLGTEGTITALPTNGTANIGDTYKVITAGTYASQAAKVGDTFICLTKTSSANTWELIPSGDEPSGTVTSVTIKATSPIAIDNTGAITTSGTRTLSHATSGVTTGTYRSVTVNNTGHVTAGTNPTTINGYGITDAKIASGTITLGSNTITPLTSSSTLDATKVSGTLPANTYTDTKNTAGSTDTSSKIYLIGATLQEANPQTYSDNEVFAQDGVLNAQELTIGSRASGSTIGTKSSALGNGVTASGNYSFAVGDGTTASGEGAHAEGRNCQATSLQAHAEGAETTASAQAAHAEGAGTTASAQAAHAENGNTIASGKCSHAEGTYSTASGKASHSEGCKTTASGENSHSEGFFTKASGKNSHAEGTIIGTEHILNGAKNTTTYTISGEVAIGQYILYNNPQSGINNKVCEILTTLYDSAQDLSTITVDTSLYSGKIIDTPVLVFWPDSNLAGGESSHTEGGNTKSLGDYSHAEGRNSRALGRTSHAEGQDTTALDIGSHAEGIGPIAMGQTAHAEGSGNSSNAEIYSTIYSEGFEVSGTANATTYTVGAGSAILVFLTPGTFIRNGDYSWATSPQEWSKIISIDTENNTITVNKTLSEYSALSSQYCDLISIDAWGQTSGVAYGYCSHVEGNLGAAVGESSHAEGNGTIAFGNGQHTEGNYNIPDVTSLHIVGNGYVDEENNDIVVRSNAHTLDTNGNAWFAGSVYTGSTGGTNKDSGSKKLATEDYVTSQGYVTTDTKNTAGSTDTSASDKIYLIGATEQSANPQTYSDNEVFVKDGVLNAQELTIGSRADDTPIGTGSSAQGYNITATGSYSHAEGASTTASEMWAHAEGNSTTASGFAAHAEGQRTAAYNSSCHAEGIYSTASGSAAHAEGESAEASGHTSHAEGFHTKAQRKSQHVQGEYNIADIEGTTTTRGTYAHIVGNGTSNSNRSNAHTLDWSGNAWYAGDVYTGSTSGTNKDAGSKKLATEDYVGTTITNYKNIANGIAGLDSNSKISNSQISTIATSAIVAMFE